MCAISKKKKKADESFVTEPNNTLGNGPNKDMESLGLAKIAIMSLWSLLKTCRSFTWRAEDISFFSNPPTVEDLLVCR